MKLKLRTLDDAELRELRERAEAKSAMQAHKTSWQAGEYSLHLEFSRVALAGQPVFNVRAQGPRAAALNRELAGLEFVRGRAWYHIGSTTIAMERHTGESAEPTVALIDLQTFAVTDVAPRQHIVWRWQHSGVLVLEDAAVGGGRPVERDLAPGGVRLLGGSQMGPYAHQPRRSGPDRSSRRVALVVPSGRFLCFEQSA